tara:strand:- start:397 stop:990 length:594 start_codon:yes stop_codon:yes gene_type:complete
MKEISKILSKTIFIIFVLHTYQAEGKALNIGNKSAKVTVKVFSSLTCPHCASFHEDIFYNLKKNFIDKGLVKFEHHSFPLDLAALNAEIIVKCHVDKNSQLQVLNKMYEKQKIWAVGSDINKINESLKKIGSETDLTQQEMDKCLKNDSLQDEILNLRIKAQKKYKIESTPTILINEKKYNGKIEYKEFEKIIKKNL